MDERLQKALDIGNYMFTFNNQKRLLQEQYRENLVYYYQGGQFTISQELISFCQSLIAMNQPSTILIDDNDLPVEIENLETFATDLYSKYFEASNRYLVEYSKLKKNRSVESIMNL
jgi:hypothetical protein